FNVSGLGPSYAIIQNKELRTQFKTAGAILPEISTPGLTAFRAGYRHCSDWLEELLKYLTTNRDTFVSFVLENMPRFKTTVPEATYLAWLDCREAGIGSAAQQFFLDQAKVAMNDGPTFGPGGEGFLRFNFGCPRSQMMRALHQMKAALKQHS